MGSFELIYYLSEAVIFLLIFYKMVDSNKEEWLYTTIKDALLIGSIVGIVIGTISGIIIFGLNYMWLSSSLGIVIGALSCLINVLALNYKYRKKKKKK